MAEKRFYWLKLDRHFFKRHDIRIVEDMPNGKEYILFYLKLLCEAVSHEGELRFSEKIPYSAEMLSTVTNTNIDIVRMAVKVLTECGMMEILDDETIYIEQVRKMIGSAIDNDNANRQRRYREAHRYDIVTNNNESKRKIKRKSKSREKEESEEKELPSYDSSGNPPLDHERLEELLGRRS